MKQEIRWQRPGAMLVLILGSLLVTGCSSFFGSHEKHAEAQLQPTIGNLARGIVTFAERADGVQVNYSIGGLPPNTDHAFQIHERGDCNAADGSSAGRVFNPAAGRLKPGLRVAGDLTNIHADANGVATGFIVAPDLSLDGIRSVVARSIVIHRDPEDFYAAPGEHMTGPALACGVIR